MAKPPVTLSLLGCPELRVEGAALPCVDRTLRLLAILALDGPQDRLTLADLLWDGPTERVLHNLRMALLQLRRTLGPAAHILQGDYQALQLDPHSVQLDTQQLESPDAQTLLRAWSGEFMTGHRTKGTENWLEWADRAENRLLEAHVGALIQQALTAPHDMAVRLIRRARTLLPDYPVPPAQLEVFLERPGEPQPPVLRPQLAQPDWLVGRDAEFAALAECQEAIHLHGPHGSGRTSLARAAWPDAHWITGSRELRELKFGAVAASLGSPLSPEQGFQLDALERAITAPAIVLDDLDQLDAGTLQLGVYLLRRGRRVLFISRGEHVPGYLCDVRRLELRPLADAELLALACRLAPALAQEAPDELLADLKALTGSQPGLLSRLLRQEPQSLKRAVGQRLSDLTPTEQRLLAAAYLLPCQTPHCFQDHLTLNVQQYAEAADHLGELHFWQDDTLTHPLLGPLALERLTWRQRRELQALAEQTAIRSIQTLTRQSLNRGDPGRALAQVQQASLTNQNAALRSMEALSALQLGLHFRAEQAARESLQLAPQGHDAAVALDVLANLAMEQGQYRLAHQYSAHALQADPDASEDIYYTAAYLADLFGEHARAEKIAHLGLRHLSPGGTPALLYATIASTHDAREQFQVARHWHELALHSARASGSQVNVNEVLSFYLWHLNVTGDAIRAVELADAALNSGEYGVNVYLRNSLGIAQYHLGQLDRAHATLLPQQKISNPTLAAIAQTQSALIYHQQGEIDRANELLALSLPLAQQSDAGRPKYEWAVAALTLNPGEWSAEAQQCVQGAQTNDSVITRTYQQLRMKLLN